MASEKPGHMLGTLEAESGTVEAESVEPWR
ncbi:MAG: hypothetical protein QOJ44_2494 [Acidimicrobiaceae bacterium]|jgi:hypothetical protein|nr:hypothetical protein [Acidimicrobiaceae bacterium]